jgi:hypothetical protein
MDIYEIVAVGVLLLMPLLIASGLYWMAKFAGVTLVDWRAIRRLRRNPRFGLLGMMAATAAVAVDLTLMRLLGIDLASPGAICIGGWLLLFAVAIVGLVFVLVDDFSPRRRHPEPLQIARYSKPPSDSGDTQSKSTIGQDEMQNQAFIQNRDEDLRLKDDPAP